MTASSLRKDLKISLILASDFPNVSDIHLDRTSDGGLISFLLYYTIDLNNFYFSVYFNIFSHVRHFSAPFSRGLRKELKTN